MIQPEKMGALIRELRKEKGLTQEQMAEKFYVSNRTISRWENGKNVPDSTQLVRIAEFFQISVDELIACERKEEKLIKDPKEELKNMASYADEQKVVTIKRIQLKDKLGLGCCFVAAMAMDGFIRFGNNYFALIHMFLLIVTMGIIAWNILNTSGIITALNKYQKNNKWVLYIEIAIIVLMLFFVIKSTADYLVILENFRT